MRTGSTDVERGSPTTRTETPVRAQQKSYRDSSRLKDLLGIADDRRFRASPPYRLPHLAGGLYGRRR